MTGNKTGVFGGTFDPPHKGHVECCCHVLKTFGLDRIIVVPAGCPPHKDKTLVTPFDHRLKMTELAFEGISGIETSDVESLSDAPSYTFLTMNKLKTVYKNHDLFFIMGEDNLPLIHTWKNYRSLIRENEFIVMQRPGFKAGRKDCPMLSDEEFSKITAHPVNTPLIPVSATEIRDCIKNKMMNKIDTYLPKPVADYISEHHLYGA